MIQLPLSLIADACTGGGSFFAFPHWYQYLDSVPGSNGICTPAFTGLNDVWLVVAAIIEIMLRVGALIAVIAVIYGGFNYLTSQGEPDKTNKARMTIINALAGLAISIFASVLVSFIAGSIK
ncbi:MAG: hypothetical protein JWO41_140 [Candidatus Saccharibacteria bacterium]|nr:hypothetical protein [Candidatus Saccharibacteria bacterium]